MLVVERLSASYGGPGVLKDVSLEVRAGETVAVIGLGLLGPYSYLGGAFALDFGGKQASAASSGIIDGIGYLGGVLAGDSVARLAMTFGWRGVFATLAAVSAAAALSAGYLHLLNLRTAALKAAAAVGAHG